MDNNSLLKNLGGNIRLHRKRKAYTIDELAEKSELSGKYLQGVEVGIRNISIKNLNKIAVALGISPDTLLNINTKIVVDKEEKIFSISEKLKKFETIKLDLIGTMLDDIDTFITEEHKKNTIEKK